MITGASLVFAALDAAHRVALGHAPTRLLVRLALSARDDDTAPWARLTMADRCAALGCDDDTAGRSAVRRATAAIVKAKLAALAEGGNRSGAARYVLTLAEKGNRSAVSNRGEKVTAQRQKGNRSAVRKITAQRSAKEDRGDTEEETRTSAPLPLTCPTHPHGNASEPCRTCGDIRRALAALPTVSAPRSVQPGEWCSLGDHHVVGDGTCVRCDKRADDIAAEPIRSRYVGGTS
ncbi:hypothetical protein ACNPNP_19665 [Microbacterium sp. AGC85]